MPKFEGTPRAEEGMEDHQDNDDGSFEESLASLKRSIEVIPSHVSEITASLLSVKNQLASVSYTPRTRFLKWLGDRGLTCETSFQEFFPVFLKEHAAEGRLDLQRRTVALNPSACRLFQMPQATILPILELLRSLPLLYA